MLFTFSNRSAKEAEDNIRKALEKGQVLPKEERFDSNCITPGMHIHHHSKWVEATVSEVVIL